ncbi:DNAH6 [Symbiodinium sp. CCMP2456]|nr:DNAH6 [Symbiodinium sp. CCMP2456]
MHSRSQLRRRLYEEPSPSPSPRARTRPCERAGARPNSARLGLKVADAQRLLDKVSGRSPGPAAAPAAAAAAAAPQLESLSSPLLPPLPQAGETGARVVSLSPEMRHEPEPSAWAYPQTSQLGIAHVDVEPESDSQEEFGSLGRPFDIFLEILRGAEQREETLGKEFVYVRHVEGGSAYDLELVPFREVQLESYMTAGGTVSPAGMSTYVKGLPTAFVSLKSWLQERRLFRLLRRFNFFQEFPKRKAFLHWRNAGRWGRMTKAGRVLEERVFFLHPWFRSSYFAVREIFQDVANLRCLRCHFPQPQTLAEFQVAQKNWQHDLFQRARQLAAKVMTEVSRILSSVIDQVRRETSDNSEFTRQVLVSGRQLGSAAIVRAGMDQEDSEALERLGFSKDVSFAQRSRLRFECGRLLRFARLVDLLCTESLVEVLEASIAETVRSLGLEQGRPEEGHGSQILLKVTSAAHADHVAQTMAVQLCPSDVDVSVEFINWLRHGCTLATFFTCNYASPDLVAHRFLVRSGVSNLEDKDEEEEEREADELLFERLQGQAGWQRSCLRLSETLRTAFREADSKLRVLDGNLKWCYECQNAVIPDIIKGIWLCGPVTKFAEILTDYKEGLQDFEKLSSRHFLRPLEIEIAAMLSELKQAPARCLSELAEKLPEVVLLCAEELSQWIGNKTRQLSRHPGCVAEFVSDLQNLEETRGALGTQAELLARMQRLYEILEEHRVYLSTTLRAKVASMPRSFANFEAVFAKKEEKVVEEREGFLERFAAELSALEAKVQVFASEEQVRHPELLQLPSTASLTAPALAAGCVPDFAGEGSAVEVSSKLRELEALQEALRKLQEDQELYQSYQDVMKGDGLVVPDLRDAWLQLQRRLDLWRTFEDWQRKCQEWLPSDLLLVDLMLMSKDVTSLWVQADAAQHDLPENAVFEELQSQLKYMQDLIPVLEVLQNPHLRGRHWKELSATLDVTLDVSHAGRPQLALGQAANWNLTKEMASLLTIARRATQEHYVELALENLTRSWSRLELPIVDSGGLRVESLAGLLEQLQDGLAVVGSSSSRFAAVHADRVKLWQARFEKVEELLSELGSCQERFGHLEGVFATDLQKQLPNEFLTFQPVESTWKALLLRLSQRPQVVELALDPQNLQTLRQLGETMDSILRDLDGFLVTKRQSFPRLFFFSDAVLLQFLRLFGKRSSPRAMESLARQCFPGLGSWELEDGAVTLLSVAGERLPAKVKLRGPEQTLEAIQASMTAAFRQLLKGAIEEAAAGNALEWAVASALPSQVVEVAWQVTWTMQLESLLLQSREAAKEHLQQWHSTLQLRLLQRAVRQGGAAQRRVASSLLVVFKQRQSQLEFLVRGASPGSFDFQKHLRYSLDLKGEALGTAAPSALRLNVSQLSSSFAYGWEFLGSTERLVMAPETERCWIALTQACRLHLGVALVGAHGSGKTELSKGLAAALGLYCVVYHVARRDVSDLSAQFMEGVALQGCWLLLDRIHLLHGDNLGTWAWQLRRFQEAQRAQRESFDLQGRMVTLKPGATISATVDSRLGPSFSATFESLQSCLRPVSLAFPSVAHVSHLAEVLLLAEGFSEDPDLGKKVGIFWGHLVSLQEAQEPFFGLRALRVLIEKAGALRRRHDGSTGLAGLAVEVFEPNLLAQLFQYQLQSLIPKEELEALADVFQPQGDHTSLLQSRGRSQQELAVEKLEESLVAQPGVVLLGHSGAGKSRLLEDLQRRKESFYAQRLAALAPNAQSGQAGAHGAANGATVTGSGKASVLPDVKATARKMNQEDSASAGSGTDELADEEEKEELIEVPKIQRIYSSSYDCDELYGEAGSLVQLLSSFAQAELEEGPGAGAGAGVAPGATSAGTLQNQQAPVAHVARVRRVPVPWVVLDGELGPWADALHGFLDRDRHFWIPGFAHRIELQQALRVVFECVDLAEASPALVTRCAVVALPEVPVAAAFHRLQEMLQRASLKPEQLQGCLEKLQAGISELWDLQVEGLTSEGGVRLEVWLMSFGRFFLELEALLALCSASAQNQHLVARRLAATGDVDEFGHLSEETHGP